MKVTIKNLQKKIPVNPTRIKRAIRKVIAGEAAKDFSQITVCFVNDKKILKLNKKFLHKSYTTDVLAFDTKDIVICADTAARNAKIYKTSVSDELELYAVHGVLHLLGYDDHAKKDTALMRKKESIYANT